MAAITLEDLNKNAEAQQNTLESIEKNTQVMSSSLSKLVKSLGGFKGDELEAQREAGGGAAGGAGGGLIEKMKDSPFSGLLGRIMPIILGIAGALVASFTELGNDIARTFASIFTVKKLFPNQLAKLGDTISARVASVADFLKKGLYKILLLGEDGKPIARVAKGLQGAQGAGPVVKFLRSITNVFSKIGEVASKIPFEQLGKMLQTVGGVLKKIFLPIGLIFTVYDTVKEAIAGYEDGGFLGGLTGAIGGLLGSIVGAPLDLLKSIVSWVLEKFGFENASATLDSFNIQETIVKFFHSIPDALNGAIDYVKEKFAAVGDFFANIDFGQIMSDIGDALFFAIQDASHNVTKLFSGGFNADIEESLKGFIRSVLPNPEESPILSKFVPDSLYEWAGLDPKTGQAIKKPAFDDLEADIAGMEEVDYTEDQIQRRNAAMLRKGSLTGLDESASNVVLSESAKAKALRMQYAGSSVTAAGLKEQTDEMNAASRSGAAPIVIQDNSTKSVGGNSSQGVVMKSTPIDHSDPFAMSGIS